jgi:hypothetical protein
VTVAYAGARRRIMLPPDLQPLIGPATHTYQRLQEAGAPITMKSFGVAMRDDGQPLGNDKITPLLTAVRAQFEQA